MIVIPDAALSAFTRVFDGGAVDADDRIIYDTATGALSFHADGSGATAAIQFATLTNFAAISSADFLVV
jgi:Ca2+-binding RTX toxin-like protein